MKKLCLIMALSLMLFATGAALAGAGAVPAPFTKADVDQLAEGLTTVGDFVKALSPAAYSWEYEGPATGVTYLTMTSRLDGGAALGDATVALTTDDGMIGGKESGESDALPEEILSHDAWLVAARWMSADYRLPAVRGVAVGAGQADVVSAFFSTGKGEPSYAAKDINPAVDDSWRISEGAFVGAKAVSREDGKIDYLYGWCTLEEPDQWREYQQLDYLIADGVVQSVELSYGTDPE